MEAQASCTYVCAVACVFFYLSNGFVRLADEGMQETDVVYCMFLRMKESFLLDKKLLYQVTFGENLYLYVCINRIT